jgi:hypothetical protein
MDFKTILAPCGATIVMILNIFILKYREQDFDPYGFLITGPGSQRYARLRKLLLIFYYERTYGIVKFLCRPGFVSACILVLIFMIMLLVIAKEQDTKSLYSDLLWALPVTGAILLTFVTFYLKYLQSKIKR